MEVVATKSFRYKGRRLKAGDRFEARRQHASLLIALGKATESVEEKPKPVVQNSELDALRERAESIGVAVDNRWREARLRQEIEAAYETRDMQVED